jgi:hypothetical protein
MLQDFNESQVQALTTEQKNHIKEHFDAIREVLKEKNENTTTLRKFLTMPDNWNDYIWAHEKIYTNEEIGIIFNKD